MFKRKRRFFPAYVLFLEAVSQGNAAVEDQMICCAVFVVEAEEANAHELECRSICSSTVLACVEFSCNILHGFFDFDIVQYCQAFRIQCLQEVLVRSVRIRVCKQVVIQTYFRIQAVLGIYPMDRSAFDLAAVCRIAALGSRIIYRRLSVK